MSCASVHLIFSCNPLSCFHWVYERALSFRFFYFKLTHVFSPHTFKPSFSGFLCPFCTSFEYFPNSSWYILPPWLWIWPTSTSTPYVMYTLLKPLSLLSVIVLQCYSVNLCVWGTPNGHQTACTDRDQSHMQNTFQPFCTGEGSVLYNCNTMMSCVCVCVEILWTIL